MTDTRPPLTDLELQILNWIRTNPNHTSEDVINADEFRMYSVYTLNPIIAFLVWNDYLVQDPVNSVLSIRRETKEADHE